MEPPRSEDVLFDSDFESVEQSESDRKVQESLLKYVADAVGNKLLIAFSRFGKIPMQWGHWLDVLDDENLDTIYKDLNDEKILTNESGQEANATVDHSSSDSNVEDSSPIDGIHSLIIACGVAPYAHAAANSNGLAGWPLLGPSDVPILTCEKCFREFCSSFNYRRHMQTHRHVVNSKKEDFLNESADLRAYWDKLQPDKARDIVSLENIMFEGIPGDSIIKYLTSVVRLSCILPLPKSFFKAGESLLELLQTKSSKFPCPSAELFQTLNLASEKTFLETRLSNSMQKFIFEGEEGKIGHKINNLVASIGFLVERRLVKAWITEKDLESLRLQKMLLDEEEAVQRRKAEERERKRLKKVKKKEFNKNDSTDVSNEDSNKFLEIGLKELKDNTAVIDENSDQPLADTKDASSNKEKYLSEIAFGTYDAGHTGDSGSDMEHEVSQTPEVHSDLQHRKPVDTENLSSQKDEFIVEDAYGTEDASHTAHIATDSEHKSSNSCPEVDCNPQHKEPADAHKFSSREDESVVEVACETKDTGHTGDTDRYLEHMASRSSPEVHSNAKHVESVNKEDFFSQQDKSPVEGVCKTSYEDKPIIKDLLM